MPALERLLYASTATGRTDSLLNVATILAESQRNNGRDGLTGALAAHQGRFLQVIEGPPAVLNQLLHRLAGDPRHKDIVVIDRLPITERRFAGWTMASARITPALTALLDALVVDPSIEPERTVAALAEASRSA